MPVTRLTAGLEVLNDNPNLRPVRTWYSPAAAMIPITIGKKVELRTR